MGRISNLLLTEYGKGNELSFMQVFYGKGKDFEDGLES